MSVMPSAAAPANPASILPPFRARTLFALAFITVSPTVTWPSPPMATRPSLRTQRIVVLRMLGCTLRSWMCLVIDLFEPLDRGMSIHLRGPERRVPQQLLHRPQVGPRVEQMRRKGVA